MDGQTDTTIQEVEKNNPPLSSTQSQQWRISHIALGELLILLGLALVAFIPRLLLATQLDVVTDEVVYILGGKIYLPLIAHFQIGASGWMFNYEHPPLVKLLIGTSLALNMRFGHPLGELLAARIPSIISGTLLVVAMYWLGRAPFGRVVALLAALSLAVSPWLVYFSALAYLDMTMTAMITVAFLLLWYTIRHPWLYLLVALLVGLGAASKYTAVLIVPGIFLFTAYYFFVLRFYLPAAQRPRIPWLWWITALLLSPLCLLAADPAIWPNPIYLLQHSFNFEWEHSVHGHLTFLAGQYSDHIPHWAVLYIVLVKLSAFLTIPAAFFVLYAFVQLVRFHWHRSISVAEATNISFLLIWLLSTLGMFSLLNIIVGTHYLLPIAPPVAFAGACGLAILLRYRRGLLFKPVSTQANNVNRAPSTGSAQRLLHARSTINLRATITVAALLICLTGPHLLGLLTIPDAEGYTSILFHGENHALQVAYPAYRDALSWLSKHISPSQHHARVGLVALVDTLNGHEDVTWFTYNPDYAREFMLVEAHPDDTSFPYDYLVWPMHLVQRGYVIPPQWRSHVVHSVMGGNTIYCYILARYPDTVSA
jgi:hypothetical protein